MTVSARVSVTVHTVKGPSQPAKVQNCFHPPRLTLTAILSWPVSLLIPATRPHSSRFHHHGLVSYQDKTEPLDTHDILRLTMHALAAFLLSLPLIALAGQPHIASHHRRRWEPRSANTTHARRGVSYKLQDDYSGDNFFECVHIVFIDRTRRTYLILTADSTFTPMTIPLTARSST